MDSKKPENEETQGQSNEEKFTPQPAPAHTGNNARASWPIQTPALRSNIAHLDAEAKQVFMDCFLWCINHDISRYEFADEIGCTENLVYRIVTARYLDPNNGTRRQLSKKMVDSMKRWLANQRAQKQIQPDFLLLPTAQKVILACRMAQESRTPVFIHGPSHIGKTTALIHFAETNNHGRTIYIRLGAASGLGGMLREIAKAVGVSSNSSKERMIQFIMNALTPDMLLILDEVHELLHTYRKESFFACIEVIREIHDRVKCGMVLSVTKVKWKELSKHKKDDLEQLFRRGVHRFALGTVSGMPLKKDIEMVLNHVALKWPSKAEKYVVSGIEEKPLELIRQLAKEEGLKALTERIRYAKKLAKNDDRETINWADFIGAHLRIKHEATEAEDWA